MHPEILKAILENSLDKLTDIAFRLNLTTYEDWEKQRLGHRKMTVLLEAVFQNQIKIVKFMLLTGFGKLTEVDSEQQTPLHIACREGHLGLVQLIIPKMLSEKMALSSQSESKDTPFLLACINGHFEIAKYLLEQDSSLSKEVTRHAETAIHLACKYKRFQDEGLYVVKYLVERGLLDITLKDLHGSTAFVYACLNEHFRIAQYLLEKDSSLIKEVVAQNGYTGLHLICDKKPKNLKDCVTFVQFLLEKNLADLESKAEKGFTPFLLACASDNSELMKTFLLSKPSVINDKTHFGTTPLLMLAQNGHKETFIKLRDYYLNNNITLDLETELNNDGENVFLVASKYNFPSCNPSMLDYLWRNWPKLTEKTNKDSEDGFFLAIRSGNKDLVNWFLQKNLKNYSESLNSKGQSPLEIAIREKKIDIVKLLLTHAHVYFNNNDYIQIAGSPIVRAVVLNLIPAVKFLLENDTDYIKDNSFSFFGPLLTNSCAFEHIQMFQYIKEIYDNRCKDSKDRNSFYFLHTAAACGKMEMFAFLYSNYLNLPVLDPMGRTALTCAIEYGKVEMVRYLLEKNYYPINGGPLINNIPTSLYTALSFAMDPQIRKEIVKLLLAFGVLVGDTSSQNVIQSEIRELLNCARTLFDLAENKKAPTFETLKKGLREGLNGRRLKDGNTALHLALLQAKPNFALIHTLVNHLDCTMQNFDNQTPIDLLMKHSSPVLQSYGYYLKATHLKQGLSKKESLEELEKCILKGTEFLSESSSKEASFIYYAWAKFLNESGNPLHRNLTYKILSKIPKESSYYSEASVMMAALPIIEDLPPLFEDIESVVSPSSNSNSSSSASSNVSASSSSSSSASSSATKASGTKRPRDEMEEVSPIKKARTERQTPSPELEDIEMSVKSKESQDPLALAIEQNDMDHLKYLLLNKGDINKVDESGNSPLQLAVRRDNSVAVKLLLQHGASADFLLPNGQTIKQEAQRRKRASSKLLKASEELLKIIEKNAISDAIQEQFKTCIETLDKGLNSKRVYDGNTALHLALNHKKIRPQFLLPLLNTLSCLEIPNNQTVTPFDLMLKHKSLHIRSLAYLFKMKSQVEKFHLEDELRKDKNDNKKASEERELWGTLIKQSLMQGTTEGLKLLPEKIEKDFCFVYFEWGSFLTAQLDPDHVTEGFKILMKIPNTDKEYFKPAREIVCKLLLDSTIQLKFESILKLNKEQNNLDEESQKLFLIIENLLYVGSDDHPVSKFIAQYIYGNKLGMQGLKQFNGFTETSSCKAILTKLKYEQWKMNAAKALQSKNEDLKTELKKLEEEYEVLMKQRKEREEEAQREQQSSSSRDKIEYQDGIKVITILDDDDDDVVMKTSSKDNKLAP